MAEGMKSGEFARFCGTTKETLRHYRTIGLLEPVYVAPNGYRMYSVTQLTDFMLINALQSTGCSLSEVKQYLSLPSNTELEQILEERIAAIASERKALADRQELLENTLARVEILESWSDGTQYRIEECAEEYYIETSASFSMDKEDEVIIPTMEHLEYCRAGGYAEEIQHVYRIEQQSFLAGDYGSGFFIASRIAHPVTSERLHIKPAGTYLKWLRHFDLDSEELSKDSEAVIFKEYDKLREFLDHSGYQLVGDVYEKELSLYAGDLSETFYSEISVSVQTR